MASLPWMPWHRAVELREDLRSGELSLSLFAADLYEVAQQVLRLTGNVVLTKERNVMRGTALEFSMATGLAKMTAGGQTATANGGQPAQRPARVQGLFYPEQTGAAPAQNAPNQ